MKNILLPLLLLALNCNALRAQVNITFELNTETISDIDPTGIYVAGGTGFGFPGDNEMTDPDGDGIYTVTVQREPGFSSYYIFLNGNCANFECKENIAGLPCSDPANFNDRFLPPVMADTTVLACFGTCDSDGSCTIVTDSIDITFELNTETITPDPGGIFLAGGGNFGNPGDNPMIDPDDDGIYTITIRKPMGFSSYYTFTNGNCPDYTCKEDLTDLPCGDPDSFNDRFLSGVMQDTTIQACFGNCASDGSCMPSSTRGLRVDESLFSLHPTLANDFTYLRFGGQVSNQEKHLELITTAGALLFSTSLQHQSDYRISTANYPAGLYLVRVRTEERILTKKIIIQR